MEKSKSVTVNKDTTVSFKWGLYGSEVDAISRYLRGDTTEITEADICEMLQGIFDSVVAKGSNDPSCARELTIAKLRKQNKSKEYMKSYLRGWDSVK